MPGPSRPHDETKDAESYNVAPPTMPPAPAGANAEIGGEAAASRRHAGLPPQLRREPEHRAGEPTPGREPILGYDGMDLDTVLGWIEDVDPEPNRLRALLAYERTHRDREAVVKECRDRLRRLGELPTT